MIQCAVVYIFLMYENTLYDERHLETCTFPYKNIFIYSFCECVRVKFITFFERNFVRLFIGSFLSRCYSWVKQNAVIINIITVIITGVFMIIRYILNAFPKSRQKWKICTYKYAMHTHTLLYICTAFTYTLTELCLPYSFTVHLDFAGTWEFNIRKKKRNIFSVYSILLSLSLF